MLQCKFEGCQNTTKSKKGYCIKHKDRIRYANDKEYREKRKLTGKFYANLYYHRRSQEDPEWNAKRQKDYRLKTPEKFNYMMAKCYFKKLTEEQQKQLLTEFGIITEKYANS
jgi:hypothetical protein